LGARAQSIFSPKCGAGPTPPLDKLGGLSHIQFQVLSVLIVFRLG
jgi:hypothetical protein